MARMSRSRASLVQESRDSVVNGVVGVDAADVRIGWQLQYFIKTNSIFAAAMSGKDWKS